MTEHLKTDQDLGNRLMRKQWKTTATALSCCSAVLLSIGNLGASSGDACPGSFTKQERVSIRAVAKPPYNRMFREPGFKSRIRRITNTAPGEVIRPAGGAVQAWNIDESLLLLHGYGGSPGPRLLDGLDYKPMATLPLPLGDSAARADIFWSSDAPRELYYIAGSGENNGKLVRHSLESNSDEMLSDPGTRCKGAGYDPDSLRMVKPLGNDDTFFFRCGNDTGGLLLAWHREDDSYAERKIEDAPPSDALPLPSHDGSKVVFQGVAMDRALEDSPGELDLSDRNTAVTIGEGRTGTPVLWHAAQHEAPRRCNDDMWGGVGLLVEYPLDTGNCRNVISPTDGYPEPGADYSLSSGSLAQPRLLAMTNMAYDEQSWYLNGKPAPLLNGEIVTLDGTVGEASVCRLAHHRSFGREAGNAEGYDPILAEPAVTLSPRASRLLFASDWYDSGSVDTYVIELPNHAILNVAGLWRDRDYPSIFTRIEQTGSSLSLERQTESTGGIPAFKSRGEGRTDGYEVRFTYETQYANDVRATGTCSGKSNAKAESITLRCEDSFIGDVRTILIRQEE
ncbi:MAG: hypothetical protein CSB44_04010 [Gammaproteobacteria bacterium]|nr:MAG: hypothetical protein CSB44_04010 [Gammaproteobacteria bacterium]